MQAVTLINGLTENKSWQKLVKQRFGIIFPPENGCPRAPIRKIPLPRQRQAGKEGGAEKKGGAKKKESRKKGKKTKKLLAKVYMANWKSQSDAADYEGSVSL